MYLIFDTETTGLPQRYNAPFSDSDNWPRMVQLAWQLHDGKGALMNRGNFIIRPEGYTIPFNAAKVHGITTERAEKEGHDLKEVLEIFTKDVARAEYLVGHNVEFDISIVGAEYFRKQIEEPLTAREQLDTKEIGTDFCAIPGGRGGKYKWPTLTELYQKLFGVGFADAHDAAYDVDATAKAFFGLITEGVIAPAEGLTLDDVRYEAPNLEDANFKQSKVGKAGQPTAGMGKADIKKAVAQLEDVPFTHLHVHTQYSILQATVQIKALVKRAKEEGAPAVAMTDHGNLMGAFIFVKEALGAGLKPIVGCEMYIAEDRTKQKFTKDNPDKRFTQLLLAKNKAGYHHLAKLSSESFSTGYYAGYPRIDRPLLEEYKEHLIATTGGLNSEVPSLILNVGEEQAEEAFQWWHNLFGDDFYVQLMRHGLPEEDHVNEVLIGFAKKYGVKYYAANNVYYLDEKGAEAHDILLCVRDGEKQETPIGRGRGFRFGFPNNQFYFKSQQEMKELFADLPDSIATTQEIVDKIESYKLARDVLLPKFDIPAAFVDPEDEKDGGKRGENAYLRHLTYEGAKKRYGTVTPEIDERLDFELKTIENTGYPGYFLIVQDFTSQARKMDVSVGPGRGSAAGSAVAYCIGITNVDPIKYDLLFERFLNPDRVSLPDIDIDFDDEGRDRIIDWVVKKYGQNQVAQIITYGTMAAKSSIRDTARVMDLPLGDADRIAKLVPDMTKLAKLFAMDEATLKDKLKSDQLPLVHQLKALSEGTDLSAKVINQARVLEGSVRNTGIHACGVIITPDDITKYVPVATAKDADLLVTQFDNSVVESAGMLKMDFLGLKTLTLIKDAVRLVKERHGKDLDPDSFPLDDPKTYDLFQQGRTVGIFQYESPGMQKHMKSLKPDKFDDLIAMNALYRPGPLQYIPNFIARKHGEEEITYDLEGMDEYLAETYGITVYQEQVMLLSQKLANFTKGMADSLRKGMGKKKKEIIDELKPKFLNGCKENGHDPKVAEKVWNDWEAFASYAFNKSHSTCYAYVAFQTAYLKAHYPAEYMAAVLSNNMNDIKTVTFFMDECSHMGVKVLGPSVNESQYRFTVNAEGAIRFGMGAIKGVGSGPVEAIVAERGKGGQFKTIWEFVERVDLKSVNKKAMEGLAQGGAFDDFDLHRAQYFKVTPEDPVTGIEKLLKFGHAAQAQKASAQVSLFGGASGMEMPKPKIQDVEAWSELEKLRYEKEVVGFYISGHPLDMYRLELDHFCKPIGAIENYKNQEIAVGGMITEVNIRQSKKGDYFALFKVEDYDSEVQLALFGEAYLNNRALLEKEAFVFIKGKVEERWKQPGNWELRVNNMSLLSEVKGKMVKQVKLQIQLDQLSEQLIHDLKAVIHQHQGNCLMKMEVIASQDRIALPMLSRKFRVDPSATFFNQINDMEVVSCQLV